MNRLYPMKFHPLLKEKIWGGNQLQSILKINEKQDVRIGEAWLLSGIECNESVVSNGWLAENDLNELTEVFMGDLVGDHIYKTYKNQFPLLFKLIDATDDLSIQVHPDDALAHQRGLERGKSEMWYVMHAKEGAELISGFSKSIDRDSFQKLLVQNRLETVLNVEKVHRGDTFFIPAGRIHSIGKGIVLAEIQQSSDTTYRIYDWDRTEESGEKRPLHISEALDAIDFKVEKNYRTDYQIVENKTTPMVQTPYFITNLLTTKEPIRKNFSELDSFVVYHCVEGAFSVSYDGEITTVHEGGIILIPNAIQEILIVPLQPAKMLEVYIPETPGSY